jgi:hypothetical protein
MKTGPSEKIVNRDAVDDNTGFAIQFLVPVDTGCPIHCFTIDA